jgi:predicted dehydrogenase
VEEIFAPENAYALELDYFARCIERNEEPVAGAENAIRNIAVVEQILETGVRI